MRGWVMTVCVAAVFCTAADRLFPDSTLGRQGRRLLPCVFLCAVLLPLTALRPAALTLPEVPAASDPAALEARMQQQMVQTVEETLLDMVNQALKSYGYHAEKVVVDMDIDDSGGIHMGQITLYVDTDNAARSIAIMQIAEKRLGTAVTVAQMTAVPDGKDWLS